MTATATKISVESDERGFVLLIEVDEDIDCRDGVLAVNVHGIAEELYDAVKSSIGPWLQERDEALREYRIVGGPFDGEMESEPCGYSLDDPKHPTYHERYAGAADVARKREKGE